MILILLALCLQNLTWLYIRQLTFIIRAIILFIIRRCDPLKIFQAQFPKLNSFKAPSHQQKILYLLKESCRDTLGNQKKNYLANRFSIISFRYKCFVYWEGKFPKCLSVKNFSRIKMPKQIVLHWMHFTTIFLCNKYLWLTKKHPPAELEILSLI